MAMKSTKVSTMPNIKIIIVTLPFLYLGGFYGSAVYGLILSGRAQKIKAQMYKLTPAYFLPLREISRV